MNCVDAIREVFAQEKGVLNTKQVTEKIYAKYPDEPWKKSTITAHLMGLSFNHPSSIHYPWARKQAFLFSLGSGRYRKWEPEQDGTWVVTPDGVKLIDEDEQNEDGGLLQSLVPPDTSVSLERDLERSLATNLEILEPGLKLYQKDGLIGQQLDTDAVGRIDILATDKDGNLVVIELKAGEVDDRVCGQLLRYMGWVKRELADTSQKVRGIIVANSFKDRIKYAIESLPTVSLKRYEVSFNYYNETLGENPAGGESND